MLPCLKGVPHPGDDLKDHEPEADMAASESVDINPVASAVPPAGQDELPPADFFRGRQSGRIGFAVVVLATLSGLATFAILTGLTPITPTPNVVVSLLAVNGALVAGLALLIGAQVKSLMRARKKRIAGAALHTRIVSLLSLFAAVPAIVVAVFAAVTLNRGLDTWFSDRTQSIVDSAITVAESYLSEQNNIARLDVQSIANGIDSQRQLLDRDRQRFVQRLAAITSLRSLSAAFIIDETNSKVEVSVTASQDIQFLPPPDGVLEKARGGEIVTSRAGPSNVIRALSKLKNFENHYLYVYRTVNPEVIKQLAKARIEKAEYDRLKAQRTGLQLTFGVMYAGVMFVFLLAAIWLGMWFADRLVEPVVGLVRASRRVSQGELDAQVEIRKGTGDLATLGRTFNQMTVQLKSQRDELVETNHMLDERRRFTEAVLSGASAGVLGLSPQEVITLANRSALELLDCREADLLDRPLKEAVPAMAAILESAKTKISGNAEDHITIHTRDRDRNFMVRVTTEQSGEEEHGYVVTFDDITELVSAQRNSAWADIARRIAHEIKNPLTPIQLSAERLRRKYGKEITSDPTVFNQCTDTIIRQVGDIGRMVDEFSSFARMPSAKLELHDLKETVREALVLQKTGMSDIEFSVSVPDDKVMFQFDRRLVTQALTNLVKNGLEAIESRLADKPEPAGHVDVVLDVSPDAVRIAVTDNGIGLPTQNRERLTEPYMTTREKGTGLGLAIVKRIMEEHGGELQLTDAPDDYSGGLGARITMVFPAQDVTGPDDRSLSSSDDNAST